MNAFTDELDELENDEEGYYFGSMTLALKVARNHGEEVSKKLGSGEFGHAYLLDSGKVLKITYDETEYNYAKKLTKNLDKILDKLL